MAGRSQQGQVPSRYLAKYIHLYSMSAHRATVDLAGWARRQAGKLEFAIVQALATGSCLLSAVMNTNRPITIDKYYPDSHPSRSTRIGSSLEPRVSREWSATKVPSTPSPSGFLERHDGCPCHTASSHTELAGYNWLGDRREVCSPRSALSLVTFDGRLEGSLSGCPGNQRTRNHGQSWPCLLCNILGIFIGYLGQFCEALLRWNPYE